MPMTFLAVLAAASAPSAADQPLAKADAGYEQCYEPNAAAKTCQSIAIYKKNGDGLWDNTAIVLLASKQPVTLETVTSVQVKNGAVCGYIRRDDLTKGKLRVSGQLMPDDKSAPLLAKIIEGFAPLMGKEICTQYVLGPDGLIAKGSIGGEAANIPDQKVKWVLPAEGYSFAPSPAGDPQKITP